MGSHRVGHDWSDLAAAGHINLGKQSRQVTVATDNIRNHYVFKGMTIFNEIFVCCLVTKHLRFWMIYESKLLQNLTSWFLRTAISEKKKKKIAICGWTMLLTFQTCWLYHFCLLILEKNYAWNSDKMRKEIPSVWGERLLKMTSNIWKWSHSVMSDSLRPHGL